MEMCKNKNHSESYGFYFKLYKFIMYIIFIKQLEF